MNDAMVTGRMPARKKQKGMRVLTRHGLNASQAVNLMFDRLIEEGSVAFLVNESAPHSEQSWANASAFVDELSRPLAFRFDEIPKAGWKRERLKAKGLM